MSARLLLSMIAGLALSGAAFAENRALVIGIDHYPGVQNGQKDLSSPDRDADNFAGMLVDTLHFKPTQIKRLTDAEASRAGIMGAFQDWLIDGTAAGDRVVFYYAGHGAQVAVPDAKAGVRLTSAIVAADANVDVNAVTNGEGLITGPEVHGLLDKLSGRQVMVVADSCFSGSFTRDLDAMLHVPAGIRSITPFGALNLATQDVTDDIISESRTETRSIDVLAASEAPKPVDPTTPDANVAVWTANTLAQVAFETPQGGVFTTAFVDGLRDHKAAAPGLPGDAVTASSLLDYVRQSSKAFCAAHAHQCTQLTPELLATPDYQAQVLAAGSVAPAPSPDQPAAALATLTNGVYAHTNDFALSAKILPKASLRLNGTIGFSVSSAETGDLIVFDLGADGDVTQLFPNQYDSRPANQRQIIGGRPLQIPDERSGFDLTATTPGKGYIVAIVAEPGTDLGALAAGEGFNPVANATRAIVLTAANLQQPVLSPDPKVPNRARRWAYAIVPYEVSP